MDSSGAWIRAAIASAALGGILVAAPGASAAVTLGSDLANPPDSVSGCTGGPGVTCVVMQRSLPGRVVASPVDGIVTKVRIRGGSGSARLRIVRPGPSGFTFVLSGPYVTHPGGAGVVEFPAQFPIRQGDFVAIDAAPGAQASVRLSSGATADYFEPSPPDGATLGPNASPNGIEFLYNADVEPDGDGDGFGDETQDGCPGNAAATGECPPPEAGETANVEQVKGKVLVRVPGESEFAELTDEGQIPVGATVDVRKGTVRLTSASDLGDGTQRADFYDGIFKLGQKREAKPVTELILTDALTCPKKVTSAGIRSSAKRRRLWGKGKGRYRTRGRRSSAAVRGTTWMVEDFCDRTVTRVKEGKVDVRDFRLKRTITLRAGQSYTAR